MGFHANDLNTLPIVNFKRIDRMEALQRRIRELEEFIQTYIHEQNHLSIQLVMRILELERRLIEPIREPGNPHHVMIQPDSFSMR